MNRLYDAVVLGAGIAGSSMAKQLADQGWDTLLVDRRRFPRHKVCGEFLSPEFQGMLSEIGLLETVESLQPAHMDRASLILSTGETLNLPLPGIAWGISRYALDTALHHAAQQAGVELQMGITVTSVCRENGEYLIEARQDSERISYRARTVIGAMGGHSLGQQEGMAASGKENRDKSSWMGVKSHFTGIPMDSAVELYFFRGGYLGFSKLPGGMVNAAALVSREAVSQTDKTVLGIMEEAAKQNRKLLDKLQAATAVPGTQAAVSPVHLGKKLLSWNNGYALLGDASVMLPPLCGDGMAMALRSAVICSPYADSYLRGNLSLAAWEYGYSHALRKEFSGPLRWGRWIQALSGLPLLPRISLRAAQLMPTLAAALVQATRLRAGNPYSGE